MYFAARVSVEPRLSGWGFRGWGLPAARLSSGSLHRRRLLIPILILIWVIDEPSCAARRATPCLLGGVPLSDVRGSARVVRAPILGGPPHGPASGERRCRTPSSRRTDGLASCMPVRCGAEHVDALADRGVMSEGEGGGGGGSVAKGADSVAVATRLDFQDAKWAEDTLEGVRAERVRSQPGIEQAGFVDGGRGRRSTVGSHGGPGARREHTRAPVRAAPCACLGLDEHSIHSQLRHNSVSSPIITPAARRLPFQKYFLDLVVRKRTITRALARWRRGRGRLVLGEVESGTEQGRSLQLDERTVALTTHTELDVGEALATGAVAGHCHIDLIDRRVVPAKEASQCSLCGLRRKASSF